MSQFYSNYQKMAEERATRQANSANGAQNFVKIGFFGSSKDAAGNRIKYMTKSGDSALVRINYGADPNELLGEWLHPAADGVRINGRPFQKIKCLGNDCPICKGIAEGKSVGFGKATTRVFIPMVIAYKLNNGTYTTPEPIAMDGASYMVEILANTMGDFGALKDHVFKLTRTGSGTDTRYSLSYIPTFDNEDIITKASLDAFKTFDVTKHSYWVKSIDDINTFLATGAFPEVGNTAVQPQATQAAAAPVYTAPAAPTYAAPVEQAPAQAPAAPTFEQAEANPYPQSAEPVTPVRQPAQAAQPTAPTTDNAPRRNYNFQSNW